MKDMGTLGTVLSAGNDINARGDVVGHSSTADGSVHAFLHDGNTMKDLDTLGGPYSVAFANNERALLLTPTSQGLD